MGKKETGNNGSDSEQDSDNQAGFMDSEFMPLDDLVYAPLHALACSNMQLRQSVVKAIRNLGTVKQNGQEEIIHLNNVNIAYEHIKPEMDEGYSVENLQLQVPLLSIIPITNLNVENAEIDFATEIRAVKEGDNKFKINGRICSREQRETDFLPRVSYKMKVGSIPVTEGMQRLTDLLSSNQMAKQLDTTPVAGDGNLRTEEQKQVWQTSGEMKAQVKKLNGLYSKITEMMQEQEKLQEISNIAYPEDTYRYDRERYLRLQSDIANDVMKLKESIVNQEVELSKGKADG